MIAYFLAEKKKKMQARKQWSNVFRELGQKNVNRKFYTWQKIFQKWGKMKTSLDKPKFRK